MAAGCVVAAVAPLVDVDASFVEYTGGFGAVVEAWTVESGARDKEEDDEEVARGKAIEEVEEVEEEGAGRPTA